MVPSRGLGIDSILQKVVNDGFSTVDVLGLFGTYRLWAKRTVTLT